MYAWSYYVISLKTISHPGLRLHVCMCMCERLPGAPPYLSERLGMVSVKLIGISVAGYISLTTPAHLIA